MASLLGGQTGNSSRLSSGLLAANAVFVSDVQPVAIQVVPKSIGPNLGKFRRSIGPHAGGKTKDSTGVALGSCTVDLFRTSDKVRVDSQVSDAGGNYEVSAYDDGPFQIVAYKAGAPDVSGATVNTLVGA